VEPPPTSTEQQQEQHSTEHGSTTAATGMGERLPEFSAQVGGHKILKVRALKRNLIQSFFVLRFFFVKNNFFE
jgi:hypothetical protein